MRRALLTSILMLAAAACGDDEPKPPGAPAPMADALVPMSYEGGALEDRITIGPDPRDAAITEPTPILDLPLVIARPNAPLSTSTIEVLVTDTLGAPLPEVGVSTGGPAVFTSAFGLATVTAVYGTDFSDVYAFHSQRTLAHARVTIRPGQASAVVLVLAGIGIHRVPDAAVGHDVPSEDWLTALDASLPPEVQATFPADAFELPWGGVAKGPTMVQLVALREPADAAAAPGGMQAIVSGERVPLAGVLSFEVRVAQGATPLELIRDATISVAWPERAAGIDYAAQQLYVFDPERAAFVAAGRLDVASSATGAIATIDRLGTWLIGAPASAVSCARIEGLSSGEPLSHASVVLSSQSSFAMTRLELDATGTSCAALPVSSPYAARSFATVSGRPVVAEGTVAPSELGAACDEGCASALLEGEAIEVGCVQGTIELSTPGSTLATIVLSQDGEMTSTHVPPGEPFCLDLAVGVEVTFDTASVDCPSDAVTVVQARSAAGCGNREGCQDLGTIMCCSANENCDTDADDDCDGLVDEGCNCDGVNACATIDSLDRCCAATQCGERGPAVSDCVGLGPFTPSLECPTLTVPGPGGDGTMAAGGCCRASGECGVIWDRRGCIAAADVPRVWGPSTTLAATSCTP